MNIVLTDEVLSSLEELGVTQEDVKEVVEYAESTQKLFDDDGNNLGKKRLEAMTVYAEYRVDGDTAAVSRVYKHRISLQEDASDQYLCTCRKAGLSLKAQCRPSAQMRPAAAQ